MGWLRTDVVFGRGGRMAHGDERERGGAARVLDPVEALDLLDDSARTMSAASSALAALAVAGDAVADPEGALLLVARALDTEAAHLSAALRVPSDDRDSVAP